MDTAEQKVRDCYNFLDLWWEKGLISNPDLTDGKYLGDYKNVSYDQAQQNKRDFLLDQALVKERSRLIDIGSGYGTLIADAQKRGAKAVGITLSDRQVKACKDKHLDVHLQNWKTLPESWNHQFDCVTSSGSFEHYVSPHEAEQGLQDEVYRFFFKKCHDLIDPASDSGRVVLTTIYARKNFSPRIATKGEYRNHDEYMLYLLYKMLFGWLPHSTDQIVKCASEFFEPIYMEDGTEDYQVTSAYWSKKFAEDLKKSFFKILLRSLKYLFTDKLFYKRLLCIKHGAWRWQFEGENPPMGLTRITFQRK